MPTPLPSEAARTAAGRLLDRASLEHLWRGAAVLGTGGGGSPARGWGILEDLDRAGLRPRLIPVEALPSGGLGLTTALVGGGLTSEAAEALEALAPEAPALVGARALAAFLGRPVAFVFAGELGPQNTLEAVRLAALLDVPIVDGDCAGRAVPELRQTTLALLGIPLAPFALSTFQGDALLVTETAGDGRAETLCRGVAQASGGLVALTGFPVEAAQMREALIPGTLSRCMELGAHTGAGRFSADTVAAALGGRVAFRGRVLRSEVRMEGGFFRGAVDFDGLPPFKGARYRIGIQNEFMWTWKDGQLDIRCPDSICVVETATGFGKVAYGHGFKQAIETGEDLTVLHLPCAGPWRTAQGRSRFPDPDPLPD